MTCYSPLIRVHKIGEYEIAKDGHKYPKATIISATDLEHYKNNPLYSYEKIACKQCIGCRLADSKNKATQAMFESKIHAQNWFLTLTYDDEHLIIPDETVNEETGEIFTNDGTWNGTLIPNDIKKFMKDLRRYWKYHFNQDDIRFFGCGEYGEKFQRPHYHIIIFNLNLYKDMLKPKFINEEHQQIYECPVIEKIWKKGLIAIGGVSWSSCAYVARYITKKQKGKNSKDYYLSKGQIPEFVRSSNKPGIGRQYYEQHKDEIYLTDEIFQVTSSGKTLTLKPPKYYDKLYDLEYPEEMKKIKAKRKKSAERALELKQSKTTLTQYEQLKAEEKTQYIKSKKLIRVLESSI